MNIVNRMTKIKEKFFTHKISNNQINIKIMIKAKSIPLGTANQKLKAIRE